mmetsp:Transcript_8176/g.21669  ORF Transcript_8176/g.21669 Transcript_8176/m.21669 type:complete len:241 (-) Transcript_8176:11-733(-)
MSSPFWRCTSTTRLVGVASFEASSLSYTLASPTDQNESSSLTTSDSGASTITSPCTLTVKCFLAMFALMSRPFVPSGTNTRIATSCSVCVQLPHVAVPPFPAFGRWRCLSSSSSSSSAHPRRRHHHHRASSSSSSSSSSESSSSSSKTLETKVKSVLLEEDSSSSLKEAKIKDETDRKDATERRTCLKINEVSLIETQRELEDKRKEERHIGTMTGSDGDGGGIEGELFCLACACACGDS